MILFFIMTFRLNNNSMLEVEYEGHGFSVPKVMLEYGVSHTIPHCFKKARGVSLDAPLEDKKVMKSPEAAIKVNPSIELIEMGYDDQIEESCTEITTCFRTRVEVELVSLKNKNAWSVFEIVLDGDTKSILT